MHRMAIGVALASLAAGCATTRASADAVRAACERDVSSDARCVEMLTQPNDGYEARAEVQAAEQARVAGAFQDRLARMRADHEARIAKKLSAGPVRSATVAEAPGGPRDPIVIAKADDDGLERELDLVIREEGLDTGSSVRAIVAAPPPEFPKRAPTPKKVAPPTFGPTPAQWLRAAQCVVTEDQEALRAAAQAAGRAGDRKLAGALALLLVEGDAILGRVERESAHRMLANPGPVCSSSELQGASRHLRAMLSQSPSTAEGADRYLRGLEKVGRTLEIRAGLPRAR